MNHEVVRTRWKRDASDWPDHKAALAEQGYVFGTPGSTPAFFNGALQKLR